MIAVFRRLVSRSINVHATLGVAWFEFRRSFSAGRLLLWFLIAMFPMVLAGIVNYQAYEPPPRDAFIFILFFLIVRVASVMGLLLWATPVINSEIEGKTWLYAVTRPHGGTGVLLGKYAVSLVWSISAGLVASATAVFASGIEQGGEVFVVLSLLTVLGCIAYGALFSAIGALIQKRAMVIAIVYVVVVEVVLSTIPATVNRFTVGYRLVALLVRWLGLDQGQNQGQSQAAFNMLLDDTSSAFHVIAILMMTIVFMTTALIRVRLGGYLTEKET